MRWLVIDPPLSLLPFPQKVQYLLFTRECHSCPETPVLKALSAHNSNIDSVSKVWKDARTCWHSRVQATRACAIMCVSTIAHLLEQLSEHSVVQVLMDFFVQVSNFCASTCAQGSRQCLIFRVYIICEHLCTQGLIFFAFVAWPVGKWMDTVLSLVFSLSLIAEKLS